MVSDPKNTCNWNLKFIDKIGLKINVKIKLGQILGSTNCLLIKLKKLIFGLVFNKLNYVLLKNKNILEMKKNNKQVKINKRK